MRGGDHSYLGVQLAAWNVTIKDLHQIYCLATYLKLLATPILVSRGTTAISCPLSYHVYYVVIPRQYK